ncbi:MAG: gliding motility-associated C-terminal domain-containing protein [Chitinophagales bacterium]|nr:gliding motility-associated C-terminal domain-containing protein [Chitinophagales bacterium]
MKVKWMVILISFFCLGMAEAQQPFECKGQYYLSLTRSNARTSGLYEVKIAQDGSAVYLDTISASIGLVMNAMGYCITDNLIYGVDPSTAMLRKVGQDGVAVDLGIPTGIPQGILYYAGDVTPDGRYLILIGLSSRPQIVKVDLQDPAYQCSFVPLQTNSVSILDVAFDPYTGILYGHDSRMKRLVTIDPDTGEINTNFIQQPNVDQLGALFFDSFGNLFGYGAYETLTQDKFVAVNKITGEITLLGQGPVSSGQDGCACPYTIELQKIVTPDTTFTCTEVVYSFVLSNLSGALRSDIYFEDLMPEVFTIRGILNNPFGGQIEITKHGIRIENMDVDVGIDTLKILVAIDENAKGLYKNQATLGGLPNSLGSFTVSDYPKTFIEKDSTPIFVIPVDLSVLDEQPIACFGDSIQVDLSFLNDNLRWSDGDTSLVKWLESPSKYELEISNVCGTTNYQIEVLSYALDVNILEDTVKIELGQSAYFISAVISDHPDLNYRWYSLTDNPDVSCQDCPNTSVMARVDGYYYLSVTDKFGCTNLDSVYVRVVWSSDVFAPNIISSNGDGRNDIFFLSGNPLAGMGKFLAIYDRWGNKVFETSNFELNNPTFGWDGMFLGRPAVNGVYTWVAEIKYIDHSTRVLSGDLTLVR